MDRRAPAAAPPKRPDRADGATGPPQEEERQPAPGLRAALRVGSDGDAGDRSQRRHAPHRFIAQATDAGWATRRPGDPATRRPGDPATRRPGDPATRRPGDPATRRPGDPATRRPGDPATRRPGDPATRRPGDPATRRPGDPATRRPGDPATRRPGDPAYCNNRIVRVCQVLARVRFGQSAVQAQRLREHVTRRAQRIPHIVKHGHRVASEPVARHVAQ